MEAGESGGPASYMIHEHNQIMSTKAPESTESVQQMHFCAVRCLYFCFFREENGRNAP